MGSGNSTRRITITNESDNVLKLSESVVERLKDNVEKERPASSQENKQPNWSASVEEEPQLMPQAPQQGGKFVTMDTLRLRQQHQQELDLIQKHYRNKTEYLERQNRQLFDASRSKLENKLNQVDEKYISSHKHEPVCVEAQRNVEFCYNENQGMSLKCSKVAKEFINCVDSVRRQIINQAS